MRRFACLCNFIFLFLASMLSAGHESLDLSGRWELNFKRNEELSAQIELVKTFFVTDNGKTLYLVKGAIGEWDLWGASVEVYEGQSYISWWLEKDGRFDGESNMILKASSDEISLGGDYEAEELILMSKLD